MARRMKIALHGPGSQAMAPGGINAAPMPASSHPMMQSQQGTHIGIAAPPKKKRRVPNTHAVMSSQASPGPAGIVKSNAYYRKNVYGG